MNHLIKLRKLLHSIPEISGNETATSATIRNYLSNCNPDEILSDIGGHGIIATWDSGNGGLEIIFRSELDALPINEINDFDHRSGNKGISHKCGHDGHSAILCGVADYLNIKRPESGRVRLLFQSSEETGEGAKAVLEDIRFNEVNPDYIFALHNLPGFKLNEIIVKENTFTASVNSMIINLIGKTSHAAEPENGINPAIAISMILKECLQLGNNEPEEDEMKIVTPVYIQMGEKAYGVSAANATLHFTLRCWNDIILRQLEHDIEMLCRKIAGESGLNIEIEFLQTFHSSNNDQSAVNIVRNAGRRSGLIVTEKKYPFKWGEDFGLFTERYKGCMFGLGAGENIPSLHNPDYDFPDELIDTGVKLFSEIINELTSKKK